MAQQPEAIRLADEIDPFTRSQQPDHLTMKVADELRRLHAAEAFALQAAAMAPVWAAERDTLRAQVERLQAESEMRRIALLDEMQKAKRLQTAQGQVVAWLTPDGERVVTAKTMDGAKKDGGAILSSLRSYSVPAYSGPVAQADGADQRAAFDKLVKAVDAEMSDSWGCNSYHPTLRPALEAARASLATRAGWAAMHSDAVGELAEKYAARDFVGDYLQTVEDIVRDTEAHHGITPGDERA